MDHNKLFRQAQAMRRADQHRQQTEATKRHSCLITTETLDRFITDAVAVGCIAAIDNITGTAVARDGDTVVIRAIHKGEGKPWIATFFESDRISWSFPDT